MHDGAQRRASPTPMVDGAAVSMTDAHCAAKYRQSGRSIPKRGFGVQLQRRFMTGR